MRRVLVIVLSIVLVGSMSESARADRSLMVRTDPNDVPGSVLDIRRVFSDLSDSQLFLAVAMQGRFFREGPYLTVDVDTMGDAHFDHHFNIAHISSVPGWVCFVEDGSLTAIRPTAKSVACRLPRAGFPGIHRAVRFVVRSYSSSYHLMDRAPDQGVYRRL